MQQDKDTVLFSFGGKTKKILRNNFYDEFFKALFVSKIVALNFIRGMEIFPEDCEIKIIGYKTDIAISNSKKEIKQDISIIAKAPTAQLTVEVGRGKMNQTFIFMIEVQKNKSYSIPIRLGGYAGIVRQKIAEELTKVSFNCSQDMSYSTYEKVKSEIPILIPILINLDTPYKYGSDNKDEVFILRSLNDCYDLINEGIFKNFDFHWYETDITKWQDHKEFGEELQKLGELFNNYKGIDLEKELKNMESTGKSFVGTVIDELRGEGREEGREEKGKEMIKSFFSIGIPVEQIAQASGYTEDEIQKILAEKVN